MRGEPTLSGITAQLFLQCEFFGHTGSYLDGDDAGKSVAAVVCLDGLCADVCRAANWAGSHAVCEGKLRHHPSQTVEDRRTRADQRAPHKDCNGVRLSSRRHVGHRGPPSQRSGQSPRLTCLTRGAATRKKRHHPEAHRDHTSADHSQPQKIPKTAASLDATVPLARQQSKKNSAKLFDHEKVV